MLKMKKIICAECKGQIEIRKELVVAGKLLQPYHNQCFEKPNSNLGKLHRFTGHFPVGFRFWFLIVIGNVFLGEVLKRTPESFWALVFYFLIFNIVFAGARICKYYSYERYLK